MASVDALGEFLHRLDLEHAHTLPHEERAARIVAALESPRVLDWLKDLPTATRLQAVAQLAPLVAGTAAGTSLARELCIAEPPPVGPLATRLLGNASLPETMHLAVAFAAGLGATDGEALARVVELALGRPLTTREYISVQDLSIAKPSLHELEAFAGVVAQLGAASREGGGFPEGVEVVQAFGQARRLSRDVP